MSTGHAMHTSTRTRSTSESFATRKMRMMRRLWSATQRFIGQMKAGLARAAASSTRNAANESCTASSFRKNSEEKKRRRSGATVKRATVNTTKSIPTSTSSANSHVSGAVTESCNAFGFPYTEAFASAISVKFFTMLVRNEELVFTQCNKTLKTMKNSSASAHTCETEKYYL